MSETPVSGNDPDLADGLIDALMGFTSCIDNALADICSVGLTIGESYVPFMPDEEDGCAEGEEVCSQAWVRVMGSQPKYEEPSFEMGGCGGVMTLSLEVGVLRCIDIPEDGEAFTANDALIGAMQAMTDMKAIYCAAMACEVWDSIDAGIWVPVGPLGAQHGGTWTFEVEI